MQLSFFTSLNAVFLANITGVTTTYTKGEMDMTNTNQLIVAASEKALQGMKIEIAQEFGVTLGANSTARANGSVGGEITKRLVQLAQQQLI